MLFVLFCTWTLTRQRRMDQISIPLLIFLPNSRLLRPLLYLEMYGRLTAFIHMSNLRRIPKVGAHFIFDTILPNSQKLEIRWPVGALIYCILRGIPINTPKILAWDIYHKSNLATKKGRSGHPSLIHSLVLSNCMREYIIERFIWLNPIIDGAELNELGEDVPKVDDNAPQPARRARSSPPATEVDLYIYGIGRVLTRIEGTNKNLQKIREKIGGPTEEFMPFNPFDYREISLSGGSIRKAVKSQMEVLFHN